MLRRVVSLNKIDVSEVRTASIIRTMIIAGFKKVEPQYNQNNFCAGYVTARI
jgi:hypothetical protein